MRAIYTVGHSNRTLQEFIELLKGYNISVLVDVRRFPSSKKFPHFNGDELKHVLEENGIKYIWLGEPLGGFRKGGYMEYMKTKEFQRGIAWLISLAESEETLAIMCKERLWFRCHRRFISSALREKGYEIIHIIEKGRAYMPFKGR